MAVVQMQKVRVVVHQHDVDDFLQTMQRHGAMEFSPVSQENLSQLTAIAPHAALLARLHHAVQFLLPYETKRSLWRTLRDGSLTEQTEAAMQERVADVDAVASVVSDVESLQVELAEKTSVVAHLEVQLNLLKAWKPVTDKLGTIDTAMTRSVLVTQSPDNKKIPLETTLNHVLPASESTTAVEYFDNVALVTTVAEASEALETALIEAELVVIERPKGVETAAVELVATEGRLAAARGEQGVVHDQAEHIAHTHLRDLQVTSEVLEWEQDRFTTLDSGKSTVATAVFDGWLMADRHSVIEAELTDKQIAAVFTELPVAADELPPVEIQNSGIFQPFEVVTRLYGMPGYKDLDPTLFLAGFFFLFFGLSLTDVGYGITLMVVATIVLTLFKVAPGVRTFMKLLLVMGFGSALLGMLFGGYLGVPMESLPQWLQAIQVFDPIGNPLPVFYLALSLGVIQIMFGLLLKIYSESRNGRLVDGLIDQVPWLVLFVLGILQVGIVVEQVTFITTDTLIKLVYVTVVLIALAAARKGEGIVGKIIAVLAALYNDTIGYFSDILSYSRLLALGLATTALAFAINLIAELVSGTPVVGPILTLVILVFGHVLALVINTLGAFIHSARLQFVEFFSKFIDGTGRTFSPLKRSSRYITAREE